MNKETKQEWVAALRSGKYEQGHWGLRRDDEFCCLGVLADVIGLEWHEDYRSDYIDYSAITGGDYRTGFLDESDCGLTQEIQGNLAAMNDNEKSFSDIADYIEREL